MHEAKRPEDRTRVLTALQSCHGPFSQLTCRPFPPNPGWQKKRREPFNGGLARRHAVALKIEKTGAKGCLGGIASAGWLEDHQIQSFSREKLFELCKKTLLFLEF